MSIILPVSFSTASISKPGFEGYIHIWKIKTENLCHLTNLRFCRSE